MKPTSMLSTITGKDLAWIKGGHRRPQPLDRTVFHLSITLAISTDQGGPHFVVKDAEEVVA